MIRVALLLAVAVITATHTSVLLIAMGGVPAQDDWKTPPAEFVEVPSDFEIETADLAYQFTDIAQHEPEFAYLLLLDAGVDPDVAFHLVIEAANTTNVAFPD